MHLLVSELALADSLVYFLCTASPSQLTLLAVGGQPGCSIGILIAGHHAVSKYGRASRCNYFVRCCNCKEIVAGRDFATHTDNSPAVTSSMCHHNNNFTLSSIG